MGSSMLVLPVLTRVLGAEEFGRAATALVITQILQLLASAGLPSAALRRYFDDDGQHAARRARQHHRPDSRCSHPHRVLTVPTWAGFFNDSGLEQPLRLAAFAAAPLAVLNAGQSLLRAMERPVAFVVTSMIGSVGAQTCGLAMAIARNGIVADYLLGVIIEAISRGRGKSCRGSDRTCHAPPLGGSYRPGDSVGRPSPIASQCLH